MDPIGIRVPSRIVRYWIGLWVTIFADNPHTKPQF
jgi:hypothetical protein